MNKKFATWFSLAVILLFVSFKDENTLVIVNPGKRQIEFRTLTGEIIRAFGEEGMGLEHFSGCCNPSHIALMPDGNIVTAEKGLNRIKVLHKEGTFIELVSQSKSFKASKPLDLAVDAAGTIFAANEADSVLYIFKRNRENDG